MSADLTTPTGLAREIDAIIVTASLSATNFISDRIHRHKPVHAGLAECYELMNLRVRLRDLMAQLDGSVAYTELAEDRF